MATPSLITLRLPYLSMSFLRSNNRSMLTVVSFLRMLGPTVTGWGLPARGGRSGSPLLIVLRAWAISCRMVPLRLSALVSNSSFISSSTVVRKLRAWLDLMLANSANRLARAQVRAVAGAALSCLVLVAMWLSPIEEENEGPRVVPLVAFLFGVRGIC